MEEVNNHDWRSFLFKIFLPALTGLSIKLAIQNSKKPVTIFDAITSFVTGIGSAYLFSSIVMSECSPEYIPLVMGIISISGEKIGTYLVYKFNVWNFVKLLLERLKK